MEPTEPSTPTISFVKPEDQSTEEYMLWREEVANVPKHWVRTVTACNSHCLFCLDMDTPRNVYLSEEEVKAEILRGRTELNAWKIILSGGEASLHPLFPEFIRYAKEVGYGRIQTVTNGWRYADRDYYETCVKAGLQEMTFSLHGHTAELHNRLTQHRGSFERIVKSIRRAARDPRMIASVDVVINKQNVGVLDKIVELSVRLGITEFDLLHVIPQSAGYDNRDELFYNPRAYLPVLQKVFRLNRHPGFVVWTNRFPVAFLEGMEDLIQDPHKMLDEINGRRFHVRKYLDTGEQLNCREPDRCVHCFIEPYCTTMERTVERQNEETWEVWDVAADRKLLKDVPTPLPYGISKVGVTLDHVDDVSKAVARLPEGAGLYVRVDDAAPLVDPGVPTVWVARTAAQLDAWLSGPLPDHVAELEIQLNRDTAAWMLEHRPTLESVLARVRVHQPSFEHMKDATDQDVRDPAAFFQDLGLRVRASGLPPCNMPGTALLEARPVLPARIFEKGTGRFDIQDLAKFHVREGYTAKSVRCEDCALTDRCDGMHINMIRDQGLKLLRPLVAGDPWTEDARAQLHARYPEPIRRILHGRPAQPAAPSLPGYAMPTSAPEDPLAIVEANRTKEREARLAKAKAMFAGTSDPAEAK